MKKLTLDVEGRRVEGTAVYNKGVMWVHLDGHTFTVDTETRKNRKGGRSGASAANPGEIAAPMPGKIIKINAKKGDRVSSGQVLLVMEAMKMEYTLKAPTDTSVAEVLCEPGQQVALGQVLMKMDQT